MASLSLLIVLTAIVAGSEWLAKRGVFRHIGSALLVIILGAVAADGRTCSRRPCYARRG